MSPWKNGEYEISDDDHLAVATMLWVHEHSCAKVRELLGNYENDHGQPPHERLDLARLTACDCDWQPAGSGEGTG